MKLDENSGVPLYYQLKEILREQIVSNNLKAGEGFPPEFVISEMYGVSRATVRQALQELVREGLIYRKQGKGTFVTVRKIVSPLIEMSFTNQMEDQGLVASSKVISVDANQAQKEERIKLQLDDNAGVYKVVRLRLANNEPLILETSYIPHFVYPDLLKENMERMPIFKNIIERFSLERIETFLESVLPKNQELSLLNIDNNTPVIIFEQIVHAKQHPLALIYWIVRGDKCKYHLNFYVNKAHGNYPVDIDMLVK